MSTAGLEQDAVASLASARARIAHELLAWDSPQVLGEISLQDHQRTAISRVRALLRLTNGALLADGTGLGKTFVALAVAGAFEQPLIIAPASLFDSWERAMARAHVRAAVISMERLSRRD